MATLNANIFKAAEVDNDHVSVGENVFYDGLPKGITKETVEKVRDYEGEYARQAANVLATATKQHVADNPDCETVTGEFSMGKGVTLHHSFHRNAETKEWNSVSSIDRDIGNLIDSIKADALSQFED